jgi:hypothetical protein
MKLEKKKTRKWRGMSKLRAKNLTPKTEESVLPGCDTASFERFRRFEQASCFRNIGSQSLNARVSHRRRRTSSIYRLWEPDYSDKLRLFSLHISHAALISISERPLAGVPLGLTTLTLQNLFPASQKTQLRLYKDNFVNAVYENDHDLLW